MNICRPSPQLLVWNDADHKPIATKKTLRNKLHYTLLHPTALKFLPTPYQYNIARGPFATSTLLPLRGKLRRKGPSIRRDVPWAYICPWPWLWPWPCACGLLRSVLICSTPPPEAAMSAPGNVTTTALMLSREPGGERGKKEEGEDRRG